MIHRATAMIEKAFQDSGIECRVLEHDVFSAVAVETTTEGGREFEVVFLSWTETNAVHVYMDNLLGPFRPSRREKVLEACNKLNRGRFFRYYLGDNGCIGAAAEIPTATDDACLGKCCIEILERARTGIDAKLDVILENVSNEKREPDAEQVLAMLRELRETPLRG